MAAVALASLPPRLPKTQWQFNGGGGDGGDGGDCNNGSDGGHHYCHFCPCGL